MNKKIIVLFFIMVIFTDSCTTNQQDYIKDKSIDFEEQTDTSEKFSSLYNRIADDYYEISNYNKLDLYRNDDSAIIVFDFNDSATYEDVYHATEFFRNLFIEQHGQVWVSAGKMSSGFSEAIYDSNYEFWNDAYLVCKIKGNIIYQRYYKMGASKRLVFEKEYIHLNSNLFELKEEQIERFKNLSKLTSFGKCRYYRNGAGNKLYIEIVNKKQLDDKAINSIDKVIKDLDDELIYYYNISYPKISIRLKDNHGIYYKKNYVLNAKKGFE